ncbi:MAG: hypothetical protein LAT84_08820 [Balneolia bacterium]|nr:hypothetical protein [Balneolia bacterium]
MLFNLDDIKFINDLFTDRNDYKNNIPNLIADNPNAPEFTSEVMINILESSAQLWENKSFAPVSQNNRFRTNFHNSAINNPDMRKGAEGFICRNGVIIADAEGGAIGFIGGGPIGGFIGGAIASIIMNEILEGDDLIGNPVCDDDEED